MTQEELNGLSEGHVAHLRRETLFKPLTHTIEESYQAGFRKALELALKVADNPNDPTYNQGLVNLFSEFGGLVEPYK